MREILFRGYSTVYRKWFYGDLLHCSDGLRISNEQSFVAVSKKTIGQFTGLHNGAGQKIFEDDIVRFEGNLYRVRREDETPGGVWSSTAYILQQIGWDCLMSFEDTIDDYSNEICVEIVGNIHDNPELLK